MAIPPPSRDDKTPEWVLPTPGSRPPKENIRTQDMVNIAKTSIPSIHRTPIPSAHRRPTLPVNEMVNRVKSQLLEEHPKNSVSSLSVLTLEDQPLKGKHTRGDSVEFGVQLITAGIATAQEIREAMEASLGKSNLKPEEKMRIATAFNEFSEKVMHRLSELNQKIIEDPRIGNNNLDQEMDGSSKSLLSESGKALRELESEVLGEVDELYKFMVSHIPKGSIESEIQGIRNSVGKRFKENREKIIYNQKHWDPTHVENFKMQFQNARGEKSLGESSFIAAGAPYSSAAARNRGVNTAVLPNFFMTSYKIDGKPCLLATRSAIPTEFDAKESERAAVTKKLVKQSLKVHAEKAVIGLSPDLLNKNTPKNPVVLPYLSLTLLTPDKPRRWLNEAGNIFKKVQDAVGISDANKISLGVTNADDELKLMQDSYKAHMECKDEVFEVTLEGGKKAYVKFDIHFMNVPNNIIFKQMPSFATNDTIQKQANFETINGIKKDFISRWDSLDKEIEKLVTKDNAQEVKALWDLREFAQKSRQELSRASPNEYKQKLLEWVGKVEARTAMLKMLKTQPEFKALAAKYELLFAIEDLMYDINDYVNNDLHKEMDQYGQNPFAFPARILALTQLLNYELHFGCRSGKDRTGLLDSEVKFLWQLDHELGRMPSFHEEVLFQDPIYSKKYEFISLIRRTIHSNSGNADYIPRANIGFEGGMRTGGVEMFQDQEAFQRMFSRLQGVSELFFRP